MTSSGDFEAVTALPPLPMPPCPMHGSRKTPPCLVHGGRRTPPCPVHRWPGQERQRLNSSSEEKVGYQRAAAAAAAARSIHNEPTEEVEEVDWDGPFDGANPLNWSARRKWGTVAILSYITFTMSMASTIFAPGVPGAMRELGSQNPTVAALLISIFVIGLILGPLLLAPLSELYGRLPLLHAANVGFLLSCVLAALSVDIGMLLAARLLMGLASCVPATLGGGFVADLFAHEQRGRALSFLVIGPVLAPAIGPAVGGYLTLATSWRWTFWLLTMCTGVAGIAGLFVHETYAPCLLQRKTQRLRRLGLRRPPLRSKLDDGRAPAARFYLATLRPSKLLCRSPMVLLLSLLLGVAYSYLYLLFTTLTPAFANTYGFNVGETGLVYLGLGAGFLVGQFTAGFGSDRWVAAQKARRCDGRALPEDRLPAVIVGATLLPVGLLWYGWALESGVHWIVPVLGLALAGFATFLIFVPVQLCLVDAYTQFATSAMAANLVVRALLGTLIPLAGPALYSKLGYGWGNTLVAGLAALFVPITLLLLRYGQWIREHPRFQVQL